MERDEETERDGERWRDEERWRDGEMKRMKRDEENEERWREIIQLTFSSNWQVKSSGVRQNKGVTKGPLLAGLGGNELRKRDWKIGPVKVYITSAGILRQEPCGTPQL